MRLSAGLGPPGGGGSGASEELEPGASTAVRRGVPLAPPSSGGSTVGPALTPSEKVMRK